MSKVFDLAAVQAAIRDVGLDAWLFYDFRGSDPIARKILGLDRSSLTTRRWFYCVPASGEPRKLNHAIEPAALSELPGSEHIYLSWQSLDESLSAILAGCSRVAMQYSPGNQVPYVSRVDAGTVEAVRKAGVEVVTSADLVQVFDAVLTPEQFESHQRAAQVLHATVDEVFSLVAETLLAGRTITEWDVVRHVLARFEEQGLVTDHAPIVGVNEHAADPHFEVPEQGSSEIRRGDLLLFDLWAKEKAPGSIMADITWCAFAGPEAPSEMLQVFDIVRRARDAAVARANAAIRAGEDLRGYQLDRATRSVIEEAGYGDRFIHRTGHSIHEETHGNGANLDDLETHDTRRILPGTVFSVEPGIYLPGRFGIRSEIDVYHAGTEAIVTGPGPQEALVTLPL